MAGVGDTERWYQEYKDQANFLMVYIEEAHPGDIVGGLQVNQTENYEQREAVAELCTTSLDLTFPTVLDKLDNAVEITYAAFPDRPEQAILFCGLPGDADSTGPGGRLRFRAHVGNAGR